MEDLEKFAKLLDTNSNSSEQDPKAKGATSQKKANHATAAAAAPSRPTTQQAAKGHLKHTPRFNRI